MNQKKKKNSVNTPTGTFVTPFSAPYTSIDWGAYTNGTFITEEDQKNLEKLKDEEKCFEIIRENSGKYVTLFQKVLLKIHQAQVVEYILSLLHTLFCISEIFVQDFCKEKQAYESLLKNIFRSEKELMILSYKCVKKVLKILEQKESIFELIDSLPVNIEKFIKDANIIQVFTSILLEIMKKKTYRKKVYNTGCVPLLIKVMNSYINNIQIVYELTGVFWMFSYEPICKLVFTENEQILPITHHLLKVHKKEKVLRMVFLLYKNLLPYNDIVGGLVSLGVFPTFKMLNKRNFVDADVRTLLNELIEKFDSHIEEISSFHEYKQEVLLGKLEWSPVHKSEKFWKENVKHFEQNNFEIIKKLLELLDTQDTKTLAIACFDVGQLLAYYPRAKKILVKLGAKPKILALMSHENDEVKKQALFTTQKLMISKWEHL